MPKEISPESEQQMREHVVSAVVSEGYIDGALAVTAVLGRKLTSEELETILAKQISFGYFEGIPKTLKELGRELSQQEVMDSIHTLIGQGKLLAACVVAEKLSGGSKIVALEKIYAEQVRLNLLDCAVETEELLIKTSF